MPTNRWNPIAGRPSLAGGRIGPSGLAQHAQDGEEGTGWRLWPVGARTRPRRSMFRAMLVGYYLGRYSNLLVTLGRRVLLPASSTPISGR